MEKSIILNKLLNILTKYLNLDIKYGNDYESDRYLFRGLCNQCLDLDGIDDSFYTLQDELLTIERNEKEIIDVNSLTYKDNIAIFKGDITTLKADVIVNAANKDYLGCFAPCHNCIDNIIMSASGFQMRNELRALKKDKDYNKSMVKVTKGYNLPSKYVFHVAGPQILGKVQERDKFDLEECYINSLNKANELNLNNIVFCCISTGVYSFPNELACKIAINSVKKWIKKTNSNIKVIFNVFKDIDEYYYNSYLK